MYQFPAVHFSWYTWKRVSFFRSQILVRAFKVCNSTTLIPGGSNVLTLEILRLPNYGASNDNRTIIHMYNCLRNFKELVIN